MFNKTAQQPETLNEQYNSGYFDLDEYINRMAIDFVMDNQTLQITNTGDLYPRYMGDNDSEYTLKDLIDETIHEDFVTSILEGFCNHKDADKLKTSYQSFLIEKTSDFIERQLKAGYEIELK